MPSWTARTRVTELRGKVRSRCTASAFSAIDIATVTVSPVITRFATTDILPVAPDSSRGRAAGNSGKPCRSCRCGGGAFDAGVKEHASAARRGDDREDSAMKFFGYTLGDPNTPAGPPTPEQIAHMSDFVEEATKAGVLL